MGGATKQKNYLEITDDCDLFYERTGILRRPSQLQALGIPSDDIGTAFWEKSTGMLLEFCVENPRYHVVSASSGRFENRYVPGRNIYMLAEGDRNPNFVLDMCLKKNPNLLMEEMLDQALAMHTSIDGGHKAK